MIGLAEAVVIFVPSGLGAGGAAGAAIWVQVPPVPGSEYQFPAEFSCTILPFRVSSSTTLAVLVSTVPLIAICNPRDADWTSVQDLPAASTTEVPEAVVIFVPFWLGGRSGGGGGGGEGEPAIAVAICAPKSVSVLLLMFTRVSESPG